jgi:hypothetical protein
MKSTTRVFTFALPLALCASVLSAAGEQETRQPAAEKRMDLIVKCVPLGEAIDLLAAKAGVRIRIATELGDRTVTVEVRDLPWSEILDRILRINDLNARREGDEWIVRNVVKPGVDRASVDP